MDLNYQKCREILYMVLVRQEQKGGGKVGLQANCKYGFRQDLVKNESELSFPDWWKCDKPPKDGISSTKKDEEKENSIRSK